jgi:hypothetical protein
LVGQRELVLANASSRRRRRRGRRPARRPFRRTLAGLHVRSNSETGVTLSEAILNIVFLRIHLNLIGGSGADCSRRRALEHAVLTATSLDSDDSVEPG